MIYALGSRALLSNPVSHCGDDESFTVRTNEDICNLFNLALVASPPKRQISNTPNFKPSHPVITIKS